MKKFCLTAMLLVFALFAKAQYHWNVNVNQYANNLSMIGVIVVDGVEQMSSTLEIGAFCGDECRGRELPLYFSITGRYYAYLTVYGNDGDQISFKLYDHDLNQELDLDCSNLLTFATNAVHGSVSAPYVFDFMSAVTTHTISAVANPSNGGSVFGTGTYEYGQTCTLTAMPSTNYVFTNWTENGSVISTDASYTFVVAGDRTLVANFTNAPVNYVVTASANPTAGGTITGTGTYLQGTSCTLTATANTGYVFSNWTENNVPVSTNPSYTFPVNSNRTLVANFTATSIDYHWYVNVNQYANNMTATAIIKLDGVEQATSDLELGAFCGDECRGRERLAYNATFNRYLLPLTIYGNDGNTITFRLYDHNIGQELDVNCSNVMTFATNQTFGTPANPYVFEFTTRVYYNITASANPNVGGTVAGAGTYEGGTNCTLTATANPNYAFLNWTLNGSVVSTDATYTFQVNGNANYVANFTTQFTYTITAECDPVNAGTITGAGNYLEGTQCTLTATPINEGVTFVNWTMEGNLVSNETSITFTVTSDAHYVAHFTYETYFITATVNPANTGSVSGAGAYTWGETCTLNATPAPGYTLENWTENGNVVSTSSSYSFVVNGERNLVANFMEVSSGDYHWYVNENAYASTMTITGIIKIDGVEQFGTSLEIGVFCGTECRGREMLSNEYMNLFQHCYVFLTVYGNDGDQFSFRLYDHSTDTELDLFCSNVMTFLTNNTLGTPMAPYVFDFVTEIVSHTITVSANPSVGGTVSGGGEFDHGTTCTVIAMPNNGYALVNWTENGVVVSTDQSYTFTVTEDRNLVANFTNNLVDYEITATVDPSGAGTVAGAGTYQQGSTCTLTASANSGYSFSNWTENGQQVSTSAEYTFVVNGNRNLVANFAEVPAGNHWIVNVHAHPNTMTITGIIQIDGVEQMTTDLEIGIFCGDECRGSMRPIYNAIFNRYLLPINIFGEGGEALTIRLYDHAQGIEPDLRCTNDPLLFVINGNYGNPITPYVFSFVNAVFYDITTEVNIPAGGVAEGAGNYEEGTECTLTATPNEGYTFINWTLNGQVVSTEAEYTFSVYASGLYVANFELNSYDITTVATPAIGGTVTGAGTYYHFETCTLTATPSEQFVFSNWTENGQQVSTSAEYTFVVTGDRNLVANFERITETQTTTFYTGWTWYSTYIEQTEDIDGLSMIQEGLGTHGITIKSPEGYSSYLADYDIWYGSDNYSIKNELSYKIQTNADCEVSMTGSVINPALHPITMMYGWNWIGYPCNYTLDINTAFSGFTPSDGDQVKSDNMYANYMVYNGTGIWYGSLFDYGGINPGMGLMYNSKNNTTFEFIYPAEPRQRATETFGVQESNNYWQPNMHAYPNNMTITAVVELDGIELDADHYEVAAFANGECRGTAKLVYMEIVDRYFAFLTVTGDEATDLSFGLYNATSGEKCYQSDIISYATDANLGDLVEPFVIHFRGTTSISEFGSDLQIFPNPVARGEMLNINIPAENHDKVRMEIINALGQVVESCYGASVQTIAVPSVPGVYTLRITSESNESCYRKLIVK